MDDGRYQGGGTRGGKWGCGMSLLITVPIFTILLMVEALGDCAPDIPCGKGFWSHVMLPSAAVALITGLAVRWLVNRLVRKGE
tara:strand:+ start:138 stop:386 length:249 start_codon:yes stop_codon:yes gene_type:complete